MSERIRGSYDDALYKSTYTLLYFPTVDVNVVVGKYYVNARMNAVLAWNVRLNLEANSSLARIAQPQLRRNHVRERSYEKHRKQ